ncbi:MAG: MBL fold metallo-hydrolase [Limnochordia bacterium]|jgi:hydroxyacylglutathione hydrolase
MAVHVRTFVVGPIETNCYLVIDDRSQNAVVVDPGDTCATLEAALGEVTLTDILLTHTHFDHIGGVNRLVELTGARVWAHRLEADWLGDPTRNLSAAMEEYTPLVRVPRPSVVLCGGEETHLVGQSLRVAHAPGHTPGHVIYVLGDIAFVGDVIFRGSVGRTDFPGGDSQTLLESIESQVLTLPAQTRLLPGHGPTTTVGNERQHNPFVAAR